MTSLNGVMTLQLTEPSRHAALPAAGAADDTGSGGVSGNARGYRVVSGPATERRLQLPWLPPEEQLSNGFKIISTAQAAPHGFLELLNIPPRGQVFVPC